MTPELFERERAAYLRDHGHQPSDGMSIAGAGDEDEPQAQGPSLAAIAFCGIAICAFAYGVAWTVMTVGHFVQEILK